MSCRFLRASLALAALLSVSAGTTKAEVTLPNGTTIPRDSGPKETQLSTLFANRGEAINFVADGFPKPDTFSPLCNFKATMLLRESASDLAVGWYNADPSASLPPAQNAIFEIFSTANNNVNATFTGDDIRNDPRYTGGLIGFALIRNPPHFSEARYNTICTSCSPQGPWILSVSYRSTLVPNAYYLAFEDGNTSATTFGNDGDYNDYVMLFEGLACAGDGEPCEVPGQKGVCVDGISECNNTGELAADRRRDRRGRRAMRGQRSVQPRSMRAALRWRRVRVHLRALHAVRRERSVRRSELRRHELRTGAGVHRRPVSFAVRGRDVPGGARVSPRRVHRSVCRRRVSRAADVRRRSVCGRLLLHRLRGGLHLQRRHGRLRRRRLSRQELRHGQLLRAGWQLCGRLRWGELSGGQRVHGGRLRRARGRGRRWRGWRRERRLGERRRGWRRERRRRRVRRR